MCRSIALKAEAYLYLSHYVNVYSYTKLIFQNLLVNKLQDTLKTFDQLTKRHENEVLRKKRLAFVGISLDNVLHKGDGPRASKGSKASSQESDNGEYQFCIAIISDSFKWTL